MSLPTPTLPTARLQLRPFGDADADALFALHSSAHVLRYWAAGLRRGVHRLVQRDPVQP